VAVPDANKIQKLSEIEYAIRQTCGTCEFGRFRENLDWGVCKKHDYVHLKHRVVKQLSVHRAGSCPDYELNDWKKTDLERSGFLDFMEAE